jgi:hypothetical protein
VSLLSRKIIENKKRDDHHVKAVILLAACHYFSVDGK